MVLTCGGADRALIRLAAQRTKRSGNTDPRVMAAINAPMAVHNTISPGITAAEAEKAQQETLEKLLRWRVRLRVALPRACLTPLVVRPRYQVLGDSRPRPGLGQEELQRSSSPGFEQRSP